MSDYYKYEHDFEAEANNSSNSYLSNVPYSRTNPEGEYDIEAKEKRTGKRLTRMREEECTICVCPLGQNYQTGQQLKEFVKTPCNHKFHKPCLLLWLQQKH